MRPKRFDINLSNPPGVQHSDVGKGNKMSKQIRIRKADGTWAVRAAGAVIAESSNALELMEDGYDSVIYFPRTDIAMAVLDATDHATHCPHKGDASYFSVVGTNRTIENGAWSYEAPLEQVAEIAGHIAFAGGEFVQVEQL